MKYLLVPLLFTQVAAVFKPADRSALKSAIDDCLADDDTGVTCCFDDDGYDSASADCGSKHAMNDIDTSDVTSFSSLFQNKQNFNADIGSWDTSSVTTMYLAFFQAYKFNQDIRFWDTSKVTTFEYAFDNAKDFNQDVSCWDLSSAENLNRIFYKAEDFDQTLCWDISGVDNTDNMFVDTSGSTDSSCTATDCVAPCAENEHVASSAAWEHIEGVCNTWDHAYSVGHAQYTGTVTISTIEAEGWTQDSSHKFSCDSCSTRDDIIATAKQTCEAIADCQQFYVRPQDDAVVFSVGWKCTNTEVNDDAEYDLFLATANYACTACPDGTTRPAGDDPSGGATVCTIPPFAPADRSALKTAIDACLGDDDTGVTCCFGEDGYDSASADCGSKHDMNGIDTSAVTAMNGMFSGKTNFNANIVDWDISSVTTLQTAFKNADSFNQDISAWNTKKVTNMASAFEENDAFNQDLSCWDIEAVETMTYMFLRASVFDKTLCWNTEGKGSMFFTLSDGASADADCVLTECFGIPADYCDENFHGSNGVCVACPAGETRPAGDNAASWGDGDTECQILCGEHEHVSSGTCTACPEGKVRAAGDDAKLGDTSCSVPGEKGIFAPADRTALKTAIDACLDDDDTGVTCCFGQDGYDTAANICPGSHPMNDIDTSSVTDYYRIFYNEKNFNADIGSWDVSAATRYRQMFYNCDGFHQDISCWDVSGGSTSEMFQSADGDFKLCGWIVDSTSQWSSKAKDARDCVPETPCPCAEGLDLTIFTPADKSALRTATDACLGVDPSGAECCFNGDGFQVRRGECCSHQHRMNDIDISAVTELGSVFASKPGFNADISGWDTSSVTTMNAMFYIAPWDNPDTGVFNQDIRSWDTSKVETMSELLRSQPEFDYDLSCWDTSSVTTVSYMFLNSGYSHTLCGWDESGWTSTSWEGTTDSDCTPSNCPCEGTVTQLCLADGATESSECPLDENGVATDNFADCDDGFNGNILPTIDGVLTPGDLTPSGEDATYVKFASNTLEEAKAECGLRCQRSYEHDSSLFANFFQIHKSTKQCTCRKASKGCVLGSRTNNDWQAYEIACRTPAPEEPADTCTGTQLCLADGDTEFSECPLDENGVATDNFADCEDGFNGNILPTIDGVLTPGGLTPSGEDATYVKFASHTLEEAKADCAYRCRKSFEHDPSLFANFYQIHKDTKQCTCRKASKGCVAESRTNNDWQAYDFTPCVPPPAQYKLIEFFDCEVMGYANLDKTQCKDFYDTDEFRISKGGSWSGDYTSTSHVAHCSIRGTTGNQDGDVWFNNNADSSGSCSAGYPCVCLNNDDPPTVAYERVESGTCEDAGYTDADMTQCKLYYATDEFRISKGGSWKGDSYTSTNHVAHCSIRGTSGSQNGDVWFNHNADSSGSCSAGYPCVCVSSAAGGGAAGGGCGDIECGDFKKPKDGATVPDGKEASVRYCCMPKTKGCKDDATAINHDADVDIHVQSACLPGCGDHGAAVEKRCVCEDGWGGRLCDKKTTVLGKREVLAKARKNVNPTVAQLKERQRAIQDYTKEILKEKLAAGSSKKEAVKESRMEVEPKDFSKKTQKMIEGLGKPMIAVAPENKDEDDTCHEGADSDNCVTFDLAEDAAGGTTTIVGVEEENGSWSVVADGATILSKQTRTGASTFDMQCWDADAGDWGAATSVDVSSDSSKYTCNGRVLLVASQAGVCNGQCGDHGTCSDDGMYYVCECSAGWMGDHCDVEDTRNHCYETDCSNYGGYKASAGACDNDAGECQVASCCVFATMSDFNSACDAHVTTDAYLSARCCDRTLC